MPAAQFRGKNLLTSPAGRRANSRAIREAVASARASARRQRVRARDQHLRGLSLCNKTFVRFAVSKTLPSSASYGSPAAVMHTARSAGDDTPWNACSKAASRSGLPVRTLASLTSIRHRRADSCSQSLKQLRSGTDQYLHFSELPRACIHFSSSS